MELFTLKEEDKEYLKSFIYSGVPWNEVIRAMTLILRDIGLTRPEIAAILGITPRTVTNTCKNYCKFGLDHSLKCLTYNILK